MLIQGCAFETVNVSDCRPLKEDYVFLWWAHGFGIQDAQIEHILCIQSGRYGAAFDAEKCDLISLGRLEGISREHAFEAKKNIVLELPKNHLEISIKADGRDYICKGASRIDKKHWTEVPYRIIESGRFLHRFDFCNLIFENEQGHPFPGTGRLEISAWPDKLIITMEIIPEHNIANAQFSISLNQGDQFKIQSLQPLMTFWPGGQKQAQSLTIDASGRKSVESAILVKDGQTGATAAYESITGRYFVPVPGPTSKNASEVYRKKIRIENPFNFANNVRLYFGGEYCVSGGAAIINDVHGNPAGLDIQVSKNWHALESKRMLYEGDWYKATTMLRVPAKSKTEFECGIIYGNHGDLPAVSQAQLCLIGYSGNQLWHEIAIGNWGETICYDPETALGLSMIDDIRPLMVRSLDPAKPKWTWTNNVGGGDFLVLYDSGNLRLPLAGLRTDYISHGPDIAALNYFGLSADGAISALINASTPSSNDVVRVRHRLRYDVLKPVSFSRLAFYQLGADKYNFACSKKLAWGNTNGLVEEWSPGRQIGYDRGPTECTGRNCWFSLHGTEPFKTGAAANRGLIILQWKAKLQGKDVPNPYFASYITSSGSQAYPNIEIVAPPEVKNLLPGDFVEALIELVVTPMFDQDYYGPDESLKETLRAHPDSWAIVYCEAIKSK